MSGKEKIIAVKNAVKYRIAEKFRAYQHAGGERADMRETDKN